MSFTVLVAYAMPALREEIAEVNSGKKAALSRPDFFHRSDRTTVGDTQKAASAYEVHLASYLLLAHFSFFEAFVESLIEEFMEFHGGKDAIMERGRRRFKRFVSSQSRSKVPLKAKLQDSDKSSWRKRYRNVSEALDKNGFRFPTDLLALFGARALFESTKRFKADKIPELLIDAFGVELTASDVDQFRKIQHLRNKIAHGDGSSVTFSVRDATKMNNFLRSIAVKASNHFAENFFVIESYIP